MTPGSRILAPRAANSMTVRRIPVPGHSLKAISGGRPRHWCITPCMQGRNISVIGMGRLGVCLAAILADRGFSVAGVDLDAELRAKINAGHSPCDEPGLQELITASRGRLRVTGSHEEAIASSDITVILVGTPS